MTLVRIQKFMSQQGLASRRETERYIQTGRILINGKTVSLGSKLDTATDQISLDGKTIRTKKAPKIYWLLNKPDLTLVARVPQNDFKTIYDLPSLKKAPLLLNPVGRLDYRTEGLLILSNDGNLIYRLTHPSFEVPRRYQVLVAGTLEKKDLITLNTKGIELEDGPVNCKIKFIQRQHLGKSRGSWYQITVYEGRNRLIRRIFENHFQMRVLRLIRTGLGPLNLSENLQPGHCRQLLSEEISSLIKSPKLDPNP